MLLTTQERLLINEIINYNSVDMKMCSKMITKINVLFPGFILNMFAPKRVNTTISAGICFLLSPEKFNIIFIHYYVLYVM